MTTTARRSGRPTEAEAAELEERLRHAAIELFLARGYDGTTMEAVARDAGITKRTLYARHPDKRSLFRAVVEWAQRRLGWEEPTLEDPEDLTGSLTAIGRSALARAVDPDVVRLNRMAVLDANRFPELIAFSRSMAKSPRMQAVMDVLRYHAERGAIEVPDVELAAEQFLAMVSLMPARLAAVGVRRPAEVDDRYVEHAVRLFLRGVLPR